MRNLAAILLLVGSVGCAATAPPRDQNALTEPYVTARTEGPDLGGISQYGIPPGRCGMILYTRSGSRAVPIFRSTDDGAGLMDVDGELRGLELVGRAGETRMNIPSDQFFTANADEPARNLTVAVRTHWGQGFPSGSYVKDGTLTIKAASGWSRVVPVAGIAGCKP
ncbi:MAG: hypothetical protein ACWA5T_11070 [Parvularcula sp.]